jgi:hypothetical protein
VGVFLISAGKKGAEKWWGVEDFPSASSIVSEGKENRACLPPSPFLHTKK